MGLTTKQIEAAQKARQAKRLGDGQSLYARVNPAGSAAFQLRADDCGKQAWITLGRFPDLSLAKARRLSATVKALLERGETRGDVEAALAMTKDPLELSDALETGVAAGAPASHQDYIPTVEEMAGRWFRQKRRNLRNGKHIQQNWNTIETYVFPTLAHRRVNDVRRRDIVAALRPIWHEKPETAQRTLGRVREIFELAWMEEIIEANPATFDPRAAFGARSRRRSHHGHLPPERMAEFWQWLTEVSCDELVRQAAMLTVLSIKRCKEIRFLRWSWIDGDVWTTPGAAMKTGNPHRVPVTPQIATILENMALLNAGHDLVFARPATNSGTISENTLCRLFQRFDPSITAHGFRSSFKTWSNEAGQAQKPVEFALAHEQQGLEAAYHRSDLLERRRSLMAEWAHFVTGGNGPVRLRDVVQTGDAASTDRCEDERTPSRDEIGDYTIEELERLGDYLMNAIRENF